MTKKKLPVRFTGQHFTIDKVLIKDAIRQANISNQDTVLDIGAGKGFLTVHLLKIATMLLLLKTTQLWLSIYENYFLTPAMFKLSVVILGILQFRNFLSKWCQIFLMELLPIFSKS
jgi:Dimethyladenosine transferase (rRNA methylation)